MQYPIEGFNWRTNVSQMFGVNRDVYFSNFGLPGHNGLDIVVRTADHGYGTPIKATDDGVVTKIVYDNPHHTKGNGIYILSTDGITATVYWHLSAFQVNIGDAVKAGDVIGLMGNSGFVLPAPTQGDPKNGTHLHYARYIYGLSNEYSGFVDPTPHLVQPGDKLPLYFPRDLYLTANGDYVSWLQTVLKIEGFAQDYEPIGYFGSKTSRDVKLFQQKYGISPALGYVGPNTRRELMRWSTFTP